MSADLEWGTWWAGFDPESGPSYIEVQGALRSPGGWFPCEHPERPFDDDTCLHDCCRACLIAATANPDDVCDDQRAVMADRLDRFGPAPTMRDEPPGRLP
jgi:hypothetical protein